MGKVALGLFRINNFKTKDINGRHTHTMVRNYIRKTDRGMTYSKEKLLEAVAKIRSGELNGYEAANKYNIPRTTLYDYAKGKTFRSLTLGKPPALSSELEKVIADNLLALQDNGFYLGRKDTLDLVGLYLKENKIRHPFKSGKPGDCWLTSFCKRRNVTCKPLYKEFGNQDKEVIMVKEFYCVLEMRIDKLELADKPGHIWHIEEHSFYRGKRVNSYDNEKDLTIVTICNAEGRKAPLLTVFKGEESHEWMLGKHVNVSHNSGMCREVFKNYFTTAFLNYIDDSKPNLVIFQGQTSLIDLDIIEAARKGQVTLIHAPTYLENLNISIARTLKLKWGQIFGESTKEFAAAASQRFDDLQEVEISEDFKNSGVHPFATVCDSKFGSDRLKIYEEFVWFKDRNQNSMQLNKDTEQVMVNEDMEFQMNFEAEFDSSTSMSMTEEAQTPNKSSGEILRRALISVKEEHEHIHSNDRDLTKAEEDHLVEYVMDLTNAGFIITEDQLIEAVDNIQGNPFRTRDQHRYTYECFLKSHPRLKEKLSRDVSDKITQESINVWLYRVRMYLKKHNLEEVLRQPTRIFNFGEITLNLNTKAKDQDHETDITKDDITVFITASADGDVQAPSVLFPIKQSISCPWSKAEILADQITDVFHDWLTEQNIQLPVVLFVHQMTPINLPLFEFCKEKQIVLLALPHIEIQPLEEVFRPLREYWNENSDMKTLKTLKKEELAKVLEKYAKQDFSKEITNSFKACGIYPFNTNVKYKINEIQTETNIKENHKEGKKENENQVNLLGEVEKRISSALLEEFKKTGDVWQGDPRHASLFLFWRNIRNENKEGRREAEDESTEKVFVEISLEEVNDSAPIAVSNTLI